MKSNRSRSSNSIQKLLFTSSVLLLFIIGCVVASDEQKKATYVSLESNWSNTPIHLEACQFFKERVDSNTFWKFVEKLNQEYVDRREKGVEMTDKDVHTMIIDKATEVMSDASYIIDFLRADLAMRTYSPRVQSQRQLYLTNLPSTLSSPSQFIQLNDKSITIDKSIQDLINLNFDKNNKNEIFSFDSIYPTNTIYSFDHVLLAQNDDSIHHVIYYADITSKEFAIVHKQLSKLYEDGKIVYVLRFVVPESDSKVTLQGFGYSLAIKSLEYKVMNDAVIQKEGESNTVATIPNEDVGGFNFHILQKRHPELTQKLATFRSFLLAHQQQTELKMWEIQNLGLQTAQKIVSSGHPMRSLAYISQSFPSYASSLSRLSINETLKNTIISNQKVFPEGENHLFLNDRIIDLTQEFDLNPIGLSNIILEELKSLIDIKKVGVESQLLNEIGSNFMKVNPVRFNIQPSRKDVIIRLNNLERDQTYAKWDKSFDALEGEINFGSIYLAKNVFSIVFIVDLDDGDVFSTMSFIQNLINTNVPCQMSVVFKTSDVDRAHDGLTSAKIAKTFLAFRDKMGYKAAMFYFNALAYFKRQYQSNILTMGLATTAFNAVVGQMGNRIGRVQQAMESTEFDELLATSNTFIDQMEIKIFPQAFLNGLLLDVTKPLTDVINPMCLEELHIIKRLYKDGIISDKDSDIYSKLLNHLDETEGLLQHFNPLVVPSEESPVHYSPLLFSTDKQIEDLATNVIDNLVWIDNGKNNNDIKLISHIIVGDFDKLATQNLAINSLNHLSSGESITDTTRIAFINTNDDSKVGKSLINIKNIENAIQLLKSQGDSSSSSTSKQHEKLVEYGTLFLGLTQTEEFSFILTNGRLIPVGHQNEFNDFSLLGKFELSKAVNVKNAAFGEDGKTLPTIHSTKLADTTKAKSDLIMTLVSMFGKKLESTDITRRSLPSTLVPSFSSEPEKQTQASLLRFRLVVDPLCKTAQKVVGIVSAVSAHFGIAVDVYLNPLQQLGEMPLKSYYTYVLQLDSQFNEQGRSTPFISTGVMSNLPDNRILTMAMDAPSTWIVQPVRAKYDLDNIRLRDLGSESTLTAVYELEHLVLQGFSGEGRSGSPPGGLELVIDSYGKLKHQDTLVMGNGYFQLKANPGLWKLSTIGRGKDLMDILNTEAKGTVADDAGLVHSVEHLWVVSDSYQGNTIYLQLARKPGKEHVSILPPIDQSTQNNNNAPAANNDDEGFMSTIGSFFGGSKPHHKKMAASNETIHVFSVASGHLYERFLKIMMLSVKKNTNSPVKFWFLKNYLSPAFVEFVPQMAREYGFEVELVTYQWPTWLRAQTEKQRIIWAYKILFLDVLFPLSVNKIIFVDADQVVRADLRELWDMDLHGAALGYTPFCDSNPTTDGFRFWKTGYWRDHLRGKPYHISALYVVDLQRFRRMIAGDQLRMTYDQLSRDPNSLANLDQDLPNYLQHQVRIHSLPQEWLWCETWCSQSSKVKAKTIDLCNNPLTKTPKLENAVRIIDEWTSLDNEAKDCEKKFQQTKLENEKEKEKEIQTINDQVKEEKDNDRNDNQNIDNIKDAIEQAQNELLN